MMKAILVLALLVYAEARITRENCNGTVVRNIIHEKQVLKSEDYMRTPYQLAIDYNTNTLFFSFSNYQNLTFESSYINLKTNEFKIIQGPRQGFANAVDEQSKVVYLGGMDGIYTFDYKTKVATHLDGTDHHVWELFYKKDLYYTSFEKNVYIFKNHNYHRVPELAGTKARLVAIDNFDNIYFSNTSGLFVHEKAKGFIYFVGNHNDINGFTRNINGELFFSTNEGIYYINDKTKKVEKLISIDDLYGVAIEADGSIIYSAEDSLFRLKPTKTYCFSNDNKNL
ncbi:ommochrome-binding protein-like [Maniola hyperantus]|uniref:ommochrome-binding protein-like n=1 Tax=Aphantopus hyperantus TaxID=2795564 RepID=UPI00212A8806